MKIFLASPLPEAVIERLQHDHDVVAGFADPHRWAELLEDREVVVIRSGVTLLLDYPLAPPHLRGRCRGTRGTLAEAPAAWPADCRQGAGRGRRGPHWQTRRGARGTSRDAGPRLRRPKCGRTAAGARREGHHAYGFRHSCPRVRCPD